jgi:hypothetical protein
VTDRELLGKLSGVWRGGGHIAHAAAAVAVVIPDEQEPRARERNRFDIGQATMQMMIVAADLGIGCGHSAVGDQERARSVLGVLEGKLVAFVTPRTSADASSTSSGRFALRSRSPYGRQSGCD